MGRRSGGGARLSASGGYGPAWLSNKPLALWDHLVSHGGHLFCRVAEPSVKVVAGGLVNRARCLGECM